MNRHLYNITPSAQAETFVLIRVIRGRKKISAQADTFVPIGEIRGQTLISAS